MNYRIRPSIIALNLNTAAILDFMRSNIDQIQILTSEMESLTSKMVYTMYHTMV